MPRFALFAGLFVLSVLVSGCEELQLGLIASRQPERIDVPVRPVDLGTLGGEDRSATGINDAGQVCGFSEISDGEDHAFIWSAEEGMRDLGTAGGDQSRAFAINNDGVVAGITTFADETLPLAVCYWTAEGEIIVLPHLADGPSEARSINNLGQIVGASTVEGGFSQAVLWEPDGTIVEMGTLGGDQSRAQGVNDFGVATGIAQDEEGRTRAFMWTREGGMVDIGTLGGELSQANGIDNLGRIVGQSSTADGGRPPFVFTVEDGMRELPDFGNNSGQIFAINDNGYIVGQANTVDNAAKAFIGTLDGDMIFQLPDLGRRIGNNAISINNQNMAVGFVNVPGAGSRAILWE